MITQKINLTALKHGLVKGKTEGETLLVIPIVQNKLFLSEKRNVFLDIVGFEYSPKDPEKDKNTHLLKQSFSKDELAKMTDDEKKALPILGNARVSGAGQREEPTPNSVTPNVVADAVNDLPF